MLSFKQLQAFITLAECQSFALASEKLFVSQPALSATIKNVRRCSVASFLKEPLVKSL